MQYPSQRTFPQVRTAWNAIDGSKPCHAELCRDRGLARKYCSKPETRVAGPWHHGLKASDLSPVSALDPLEGREPHDWQEQVIAVCRERPDDHTIHWIWEPTGKTGKTTLCKHLVLTRGAHYVSGAAKDIIYSIAARMEERGAPDIVLFDVPRCTMESRISWQSIEQCKNGLAFSAKYESKPIVFNCPHIFCFSNEPPDLGKLSADRWSVHKVIEEDPGVLTLDPQLRDC